MPPLAYLATAIAFTWPWLIRPGSTLIAPIGGDVSTNVSKFGAIVDSGVVPFLNDRVDSIGFPWGVATTPGIDGVSAFSTLYLWLGSAVAGPVATHGLLGVLGIFLTATVTYMFVRRVTGSTGAGLVAGVAYGLSPHLVLMTWAATTYSHMWLFILPIWAFWNLAQKADRRGAVLAGLSLVPATFWTPYFALHAFTVAMACLLVVAALGPRIGLDRRLLAFVLLPWLGAFSVYLLIGLSTSFSDVPDRAASDFYEQAAHPLMFFLPGFASIWNDGVTDALVDLVPRAANTNLYLGLSVIALGCIGAVTTLRPWIAGRMHDRPSPQALAALFAVAVVAACFVLSLPPRVVNGAIPMPASVVQEVAPGLRAGQRFVMPLMAGTAILAGLGAHAALRHVRPRMVLPVALALALIVAVDLYVQPPPRTERVPPGGPVLDALAAAPDGAVVHIRPDGFLTGVTGTIACFAQDIHHKKLVNTCGFDLAEPMLRLSRRPMCEALRVLRRSGLRYIMIEPLPAPPSVGVCLLQRSSVGRWRVLDKGHDMAVYEFVSSRS
jgi:hypothetical protein